MAQILKMLHLADQHRVPEMQVGRRRIEPHLHGQGTAGLQTLPQVVQPDDIDAPLREAANLLINGHRRLNTPGYIIPYTARNRRNAGAWSACRRSFLVDAREYCHSLRVGIARRRFAQ